MILEDSGEDLNYSDEDLLPLIRLKKELFLKSPTNPLKAKMADRLNLFLNQATGITAAILKSSGVDLDTVAISKTSCHRYRQENTAVMEDEIKSLFVAPEFFVLHWDGKVMEDPHKKRSDRLAILISGTPCYEQGKLLGVPEIVDSTGSSQATATFSFVQR